MTLTLLVILTIIQLVSADTIDEVIKGLEIASVKLFKWFADNQIKVNQDECQNENVSMYTCPFEIKNASCEKLLDLISTSI